MGALCGQPPERAFWAHPLLCLLPEVGRVEGGDRGHDVLDELARRRLVDPLADRDERHAVLAEVSPADDVVLDVPREAVELVDDDVRDRRVCHDPLQHLLEHRPVGGGRGLAAVGVDIGE
jgi:hypothetical protein